MLEGEPPLLAVRVPGGRLRVRGNDWQWRLLDVEWEEVEDDVTAPAEDDDEPEDDVVPSETPNTPWCMIVQPPKVVVLQ